MTYNKSMGKFEIEIYHPEKVLVIDDFDDILEETGIWIAEEQQIHGDILPEYTWELFDMIRARGCSHRYDFRM